MAVTATIVPNQPLWVGTSGISAPDLRWCNPDSTGSWAEGDFVKLLVTGTIAVPNPNGSLATLAGPSLNPGGPVTLGKSASAGKPAASYYFILTYQGAAAIESLPSLQGIVSVPLGFLPTWNVSAVGAPAGATGFVVYYGLSPGYFSSQTTATALGATYTGVNPLTNHQGFTRCAAADHANIVGIAQQDSLALFNAGPGGSLDTGFGKLFGASQALPPGWDTDNYKGPVINIARGTIVMNLLQPWYDSLEGTAVGLQIDTGNTFVTGGTNRFIADTTQTQFGTIVRRLLQTPGTVGSPGDIGARVEVVPLQSVLLYPA